MKYTPPPWIINGKGDIQEDPGNRKFALPELIAVDVKPKNRRIIVSAPDLLAALKALEDAVCRDMDNKFDDATEYACIEELERTRAAIRKAEGGSR